jgi:hypothetical protein
MTGIEARVLIANAPAQGLTERVASRLEEV